LVLLFGFLVSDFGFHRMPAFAYTALSSDGSRTTGTLSADSRAQAIAQMARQGLSPVKVDQAKDAAAAQRKAAAAAGHARVGRVPAKAVESFTRELANLLAGGVPLSRAMALLRRESSNEAAKRLWTELHEDVVGGTSLGDALAKHPKSFNTVYVAMVRAGESGGFLDVVLTQISDFRTRESDLRGKVKAALVYPVVLAVLGIAVLTFLMVFFIPQFSSIFAQFGSSLPALTQGIIAVSHLVGSRWGLLAAAGIFVAIMLLRQAVQTKEGKRRLETITLATPLLGQVTAHFALVRFARMLGTLMGAGVSMVSSLRTAREAIGNQVLSDAVAHAIEQVQRGAPLSSSLGVSKKLFPPTVVEMVAVAEETGRLDKELIRIAGTYEADLDRQLRLLVAVGEPIMLFLMAAVIGTVIVGMLLPILTLQDVIH
jgi:type II secretory pathway component PulF